MELILKHSNVMTIQSNVKLGDTEGTEKDKLNIKSIICNL
jgi:hypothetical protein